MHKVIHWDNIAVIAKTEATQITTDKDWLNKLWYTQTMEFYEAIKNDDAFYSQISKYL